MPILRAAPDPHAVELRERFGRQLLQVFVALGERHVTLETLSNAFRRLYRLDSIPVGRGFTSSRSFCVACPMFITSRYNSVTLTPLTLTQ